MTDKLNKIKLIKGLVQGHLPLPWNAPNKMDVFQEKDNPNLFTDRKSGKSYTSKELQEIYRKDYPNTLITKFVTYPYEDQEPAGPGKVVFK